MARDGREPLSVRADPTANNTQKYPKLNQVVHVSLSSRGKPYLVSGQVKKCNLYGLYALAQRYGDVIQ